MSARLLPVLAALLTAWLHRPATAQPARPLTKGVTQLHRLNSAQLRALVTQGRKLEPLLVRTAPDDNKTLVVARPSSDVRGRAVYTTKKDGLAHAVPSPDGQHVALLEATDGVIEGTEFAELPRKGLVLLNSAGQVRLRLEEVKIGAQTYDVQLFMFSPDGQELAAIVGTYYEGGFGFDPAGVLIIDVRSLRRRFVPGIEHPFELEWGRSPAAKRELLVRSARAPAHLKRASAIYAVDTRTLRRRLPKDQEAFHYSPDGAFYFRDGAQASLEGRCRKRRCEAVVETKSRKETPLTARLASAQRISWAYGSGAQLLLTSSRGAAVYDPASGRSVESIDRALISDFTKGYVSSRQHLVKQRGTTAVTKLDLSSVDILHSYRRGLSASRMTSEPGRERTGPTYRSYRHRDGNATACELACSRDAQCKAYTFYRGRNPQRPSRCLLKSIPGSTRPQSSAVSGVKK